MTAVLARENAARNPRRTAATASALVIGLALVGLVSVFASSTKASVRDAFATGIRADVVVKTEHFSGFSPLVGDRAAADPAVDAVATFAFRNVRVDGVEETIAGTDPAGLARTVDLHLRAGSVAAMGNDGMLVYERAAQEYHLRVGDEIGVQFGTGMIPLRVAGIYRQHDFTGGFPISFIVSSATYERGFGNDEQAQLIYATVRGDVSDAVRSLRHDLRADFPNMKVLTRDAYRSSQEQAIDRFLAVTIALLALAEIIAVLGIVNTLALSVFERTRELGLLRVVGMGSKQMRRMIRGESLLIAALGGVMGTGLGLFWGWAFTRALRAQGIARFTIPVGQLVVFVVVALLAGAAAAWLPARRAARLDVLEALAHE